MANRKQHDILGATVGVGGYAIYSCMKKKILTWPDLLGAGLAGVAGAFLPDIIEPATSPNHRSFFHSVTFMGVAGSLVWSRVWQIRDEQVRIAEECELRANA